MGWPDSRLLALLGTEHPIVQAPMAGAQDAELAIAVCEAGGLGSLPCAMLAPDAIRGEVARIRAATTRPFALNFFCHAPPQRDPEREAAWRRRLERYYLELGAQDGPSPDRAPYGEVLHALVLELRPAVVSFHFGLPAAPFVTALREAGIVVLASATTVAEARWLEERGAHAIVAQGAEAGGHRGVFLGDVGSQVGTFALVPQVADAVRIPVIAAGGVADARGIVAAFALGATGVQIGTAYLRCPEARVTVGHRRALAAARDDSTVLTNVLTGRPARGIVNRFVAEMGPLSDDVPAFPTAATFVAPLRKAAEARGSTDFSPLWAGQAAPLARELPAGELTRDLAREALQRLG